MAVKYKCLYCKEEKEEKEFTPFKRNPSLEDRKGRVVYCKECCIDFVQKGNNQITTLKELLRILDIPFIQSIAESARNNFLKKSKKGLDTNIYSCYCSQMGIIPKNYINFLYSDGVRNEQIEKHLELKKKVEEYEKEGNEKEKEIISAKNYLNKLFEKSVVDDMELLSKAVRIKMEEYSLLKNNTTQRQYKFKLKKYISTLIENGILNREFFKFLFEDEGKGTNNDLMYDFAKIIELKNIWGNYPNEELIRFENKFEMLKQNYQVNKTAMHKEALMNYVRYRVKEEIATEQGDIKNSKEWGELASKQAKDAKINPNQLTASDLSDGLTAFGELVRAVEINVDIIPILPKFKARPQDKADFTLLCYINYIRDMRGLPLCEYKDVWEFYEQRKKEYKNREKSINIKNIFGDDEGES